jgi:Kef-type K+ transport system membrane component KefB
VRAFDRLTDWLGSDEILIAFAFGYLLLMAHAAESAGLAAIIGSYAAGLVFSERDEAKLSRVFEPLTQLLAPIFFVLIGSSIEFNGGANWADFGTIVLLVVVATGSKIVAPWLGRTGTANRAVIGSGLVPRGEVGLVFAQVGLATSALSGEQYSILTTVLVVTTFAGPMIFRKFAVRIAAT